MNEIQSTILTLLPSKRKNTPSGWISFNALCCHHRGETLDTRSRGGFLTHSDGGWQYHCFNCNFKAGWSPGKLLSSNTKKLLQWLGLSDLDINKLGLVALRLKDNEKIINTELNFDLQEKALPENCLPINDWIKDNCQDEALIDVITYLIDNRKVDWSWYKWHWSSANGYKDRVILPFYHQGKIVGWTGRKITSGNPKYLTEAQPGYVFNLDAQDNTKHFVIIVEGQFDAISIEGCAIMHNEPNNVQIARIKALGKDVIVVPDNDRAGAKMINSALKNDWSVSLPPWGENVKDVADAVKKYGRLYTLFTILQYKETNKIKIELLKKKLEKINV